MPTRPRGIAAARRLTGTVDPGGSTDTAASAVTTLVRLAGGSGVRAFDPNSTTPPSMSNTTQALACADTAGAGTAGAGATRSAATKTRGNRARRMEKGYE